MLSFAIGFLGGLRALTPPAIVAWAALLGWLHLEGVLDLMSSLIAAGLFSLLAIAEMVADKLPSTPSRTALPGLAARVLLGALCGACVAVAAQQGALGGAALGVVGGVTGCYGGYFARTRLVRALGVPDFAIAVVEDLLAVVASLFVVSRF